MSLAEAEVRRQLRGRASGNDALAFLTWTFRRCPPWVVGEMLEALELGYPNHPFLRQHQSQALLWQGVGRAATEPEHQRRAFDLLLACDGAQWRKNQIACAAFLLSRTDSAPRCPVRAEVEKIGAIAEAKIRQARGEAFTTRHSYGPYLLVGLLRWRLRNPWALVAGQDPLATRLLSATQELAAELERRASAEPRLRGHATVLRQVCDELQGEGSNPNLLADLYSLLGET